MAEEVRRQNIMEDCKKLDILDDPEELGDEIVDEFLERIDGIISKREQGY